MSGRLEMEWRNACRALERSWVCVARASELTRETVVPVSVAGAALLVTRDRDGALHAFHNVCSHRGHPLAEERCERRGRITCPYHGWSYGLDGALKSTPHIGGPGVHEAPDLDPARHGLRTVPVASWWDFVFVNLSATAVPLDEWVAPLQERWERLLGEEGVAAYRPALEEGFSLDVQGAWPLAVENYCESYHLPCVHPGLNQLLTHRRSLHHQCRRPVRGSGDPRL